MGSLSILGIKFPITSNMIQLAHCLPSIQYFIVVGIAQLGTGIMLCVDQGERWDQHNYGRYCDP
jgi:hypothetical protein